MIIKKIISLTAALRDTMILGGLLCIIGIGNVIWLLMDQRPPAWDQSTHFLLGMDYLRALSPLDIGKLLTTSNFYPPVYHISLVPLILITRSVDGAVLTNLLYLGIAVFAVYGIGSVLFKPSVGLLSAVLFSLFPFVHLMTRECMIDLALTSWVCLSFYFLIRSRYFASREFTVAFAVSAAVGMLTKWNFILYIGIPFILTWWWARPYNKRKAYMAAGAIALLASPWYLVNGVHILQKGIRYIAIGGIEGDPGISTLSSLLWYPGALGEQVFQPVALIGMFAFCILCIKYQKEKWVLLTWIIVPLVVHTFISNKDIRYTLPLLPAFALVLSLWLLRDGQKKKIKKIWITSVIVLLSFQSIHASFGIPSFLKRVSFPILGRSQVLLGQQVYQKNDWKHKEIFDTLSIVHGSSEKKVRVIVVSNHPYLHAATLRCFVRIHELPFIVKGYKRRLGEFSPFIIYKTGDRGPGFTLGRINKAAADIEDPSSTFHQMFGLYASIPLPDGSEARLYRLNVKPVSVPLFNEIELKLDTIRYRDFTATGCLLKVMGDHTEEIQKGIFRRIHLSSDMLVYKGIALHDLSLNFEHVQVDVPTLIEKGEFFFLDLDRVELSMRLRAESIKKYLEKKAPWLDDVSISMQEDMIKFRGKAYSIPLSFYVQLGIDPSADILWTAVRAVKIMYIPIPSFLYASLTNRTFSLQPGDAIQFHLDLKQIVITEGSVIIQ